MANDLSLLGRLRAGLLGSSFTQSFGPSTLPGEPAAFGFAHFHQGVDLVFPHNSTIYSPASGRVVAAGQLQGWGGANVIKILAPNGFLYTLAHFASINVQEGQTILAGQTLGVQGHTGYVVPQGPAGDHVHLQIQAPNGIPINPGRNPKEVFWTIAHGLGFGAGYAPGPYDENTPPAPAGAPNAVRAGLFDLPYQLRAYVNQPAPGSGGSPPDPGTLPPAADPCGPAPDLVRAPADYANWVSCKLASAANSGAGTIGNAVPNVNIGQGITDYVVQHGSELAIGGLGLVLLFAGLRSFTNEGPVQVITSPVTSTAGAVKTAADKGNKVAEGNMAKIQKAAKLAATVAK